MTYTGQADNVWARYPELTDQIKALWGDGLSASQIAAKIGHGLTRNAVIGKARRLNLPKRGGQNGTIEKPTRPKLVKKDSGAIAGAAIPRLIRKRKQARIQPEAGIYDMVEVQEVAPDMDDLAIPFGQRKSLLELTNATCRWPVGNPGTEAFFFCGSPTADLAGGRPYCQCHADRARGTGGYTQSMAHVEKKRRAILRTKSRAAA